MKKAKWIKLAALCGAVCCLCGCQLAREDAGMTKEAPRLIGVFVTPEHLDLFDAEAYFQDHLDQMVQGGLVQMEDTKDYQQRLYATLTDETLTGEDGKTRVIQTYRFDGLTGWGMFSARMTDESGEYQSSQGAGFSDMSAAYINDIVELSGTLLCPARKWGAYYVNPVYQEPDGRVFLTAGTGVSFGGDVGAGRAWTQTLKESSSSTDPQGETREQYTQVEVKVEMVEPPEYYVLAQMDQEHGLLRQDRFALEAAPEEVILEPETAYVILEAYAQGEVSRILADRDSQAVDIIRPFGEIYQRGGLALQWNE